MERTVRFDDGASTQLETWGTRGPHLVCLHGIGSSRKSWLRLADRFALAYRVHAYDQRGHGDAAAVHGPMTHERSVRDLETVLTAIGEPVDALLGHSWGGAIALLTGVDAPVRRVVAVDPMIHETRPWRAEYVDDLAADLAMPSVDRERAYLARYADWDERDVAGKLHAVAHMSIEPIERLGHENGADEGRWDLRERIAAYPKPLLLLAAGQDSVIAAADRAALPKLLGRNARIATFPDDGHNLHRSAFDAFANDVEAFFATS